METKTQWWRLSGAYVSDLPALTVYRVECRKCGETFDIGQLYELPDACPECEEANNGD